MTEIAMTVVAFYALLINLFVPTRSFLIWIMIAVTTISAGITLDFVLTSLYEDPPLLGVISGWF